MKKRDFLLTGVLLAAFSLNAQETMFFYGFEDGGSDTIKVDSITHAVSYDPEIGTRDTLIYLYSPNFSISNAGDSYEVVTDPDGVINPETGQGGEKYLKVTTGSEADSPTYQRVIKIRDIPVEDETSYRLTFYMKAGGNAHTFTSMQRGIDYCDKNFVTASNVQFTYDQTDYNPDKWIRRTSMYYYINDSVQEKHCSDNFWWADTWRAWGGKIYQPDKYLVAISMYTKGQTYMLDDISLVRSTIGGAEFNGDLIRINFGYQTNLSDLAAATSYSAVAIDNDLVSVTAGDEAEYEYGSSELDILDVEYHSDGYMYIWVGADVNYLVEEGDTVKVSFTNPKDTDLALKYTANLRPHTLDKEWDETKFVDDFSGEIALYNDMVTAIPIWLLAPSFVSSVPDGGSFNLNSLVDNRFTVNFNKEVYQHSVGGVAAYLTKGGYEESLNIVETLNGGSTIVFARSSTLALDGDYTLIVRNVRAEAGSDVAPETKISLTFGAAASALPVTYVTNNFVNLANRIEAGWLVVADNETRVGDATYIDGTASGTSYGSGCRLIKFGASSEIKGGIYLCGRGADVGYFRFGDGDSLFTLQPGQYWINYAIAGWDGNGAPVTFKMYERDNPDSPILTETTTPRATNAVSGANLTGVNKLKLTAEVTTAGNYVLEWSVSGGWGGACTVGDVTVTNVYSSAYVYTKMFNDAFAAAQALQATAQAKTRYSGVDLNKFNALIDTYTGWSHTSPAVYTAVSNEIIDGTAAMQVRITNVDAFYTKFNAAYVLDTTYKVPNLYSGLEAYINLHDTVIKYTSYDVTVIDSAALVAVNAGLDAATGALNGRISAINTFNSNCNKAIDMFDLYTGTFFVEFDAYKALQAAYNANYQLDVITVSDEDLAAANTALSSAYTAANGIIVSAGLLTAQVNMLIDLNEDLGVDWDAASTLITKADLEAKKAATLTDDQDFANILKLAAKKAIYEKIAANDKADTLDMTGFIQNRGLYTHSKLQAKLPAVSDAFPGWDLEYSRGNAFTGTNYGYRVATDEIPTVDSYLGLDWNTALTLDQAIVNLPAGVYNLGAGIGTAKTSNGTILYASQFDEEGDSVRITSDPWITGGATWTGPGTNQYLRFEALGGTVNVGINLVATAEWSFVDNFALEMIGKLADFDYAAAAAQAATDLDAAIESRIDAIEGETSVQYFNLNGVEISSPRAGVNIKVTVNADGSRKVEKILVK